MDKCNYMKKNSYDLETINGIKSIELYYDDLSKMKQPVDILVVSAYKNHYDPYDGTLIGSIFENKELDISELAKNPEIDLRNNLNIWMSQELDVIKYNCRRIACIELKEPEIEENELVNVSKILSNLYAVLSMAEYIGITVNTVAMPVIGTGNQEIAYEIVIKSMIEESKTALENIAGIDSIMFVSNNECIANKLDEDMNKYLGRTASQLKNMKTDKYLYNMFKEISINLKCTLSNPEKGKYYNSRTVREFINILDTKDTIKTFEFCIMSRRLLEVIVRNILGIKSSQSINLCDDIDKLGKRKNVSLWIIGYMHNIRVMGNTAAHDDFQVEAIPKEISLEDQYILVHCLNSVINFWKEYVD